MLKRVYFTTKSTNIESVILCYPIKKWYRMYKIEYFFSVINTEHNYTMLTVNQLPTHLHGELYHNVIEDFSNEETVIHRPIKTDFIFETHDDILAMIDTCLFLAVELPVEIFHHVSLNNKVVLKQMREYEANVHSGIIQESFFVTTPEYRALKLLAEFDVIFNDALLYTPFNLAGYAIENGSIELLEYIIKDMDFDPSIIHFAVVCGHIPSIDYLIKQPSIKNMLFAPQKKLTFDGRDMGIGNTYAHQLCSDATQVSVLKYLRETLQFPWDRRVVEKAIRKRNHECLKYALENGCPMFIDSCVYSALQHNTIDAFRLLVEIRNYIPTEQDILYAAKTRRLSHLIYLHELKTPWHPQAVNHAARLRFYDCVEYGIKCGAPYDPNLVELSYLPYTVDIDRWMLSIMNST